MPYHLYSLLVGGVAFGIAGYALLRRRSISAATLVRERRDLLGEIGRITDGTVLDVQQLVEDPERPATLLIYHYDVAGVSYAVSQYVTSLRQRINLQACRRVVPTSVHDVPANTGNSIAV